MIELQALCAGYGKKQILHGISLSILSGELLSVIGPNGSGKSTLLKAVVGILPPEAGEVRIDLARADALSRTEVARKVAYLAQGKSTPDMTVEQMVLHGRFPYLHYPRRYSARDREIAAAAMEQTGISAFADRPLAALSGGMRQNAYIAMALAQDADYILLDEPTTYLDIAHQLELMKTLRRLADGGKGVAAVMHDLPLAFTFSDRIAVLADGGIAACDTPAALCKSGVVKEIFGVELVGDGDAGYRYRYPLD